MTLFPKAIPVSIPSDKKIKVESFPSPKPGVLERMKKRKCMSESTFRKKKIIAEANERAKKRRKSEGDTPEKKRVCVAPISNRVNPIPFPEWEEESGEEEVEELSSILCKESLLGI